MLSSSLWLSVGTVVNHLVSWRVRLTKGTNAWKWDINVLEFHGNAVCDDILKGTGYLESGHFGNTTDNPYAPEGAFDGDELTYWGGRESADGRFLGVEGLPKPVHCVKIKQHSARELAVEELLSSGSWHAVTIQSVSEGSTNRIIVPLKQDLCQSGHHVQSKKCVACPEGATKIAGDDPYGKDTGCFCAANFRVKDGACVPCRKGEKNDGGDDTMKGDSICDFVPVQSFTVQEKVAMHLPWTWFMNGGLNAQPKMVRDMHSAACRDQFLVSWTSQTRRPFDFENQWQKEGDTFGHMTVFKMGADDFTMMTNIKLTMCSEMGEVTASPDCSVIGALCVSRLAPTKDVPNFKKDLVASSKDESGRPPFGWRRMDKEKPDPKKPREILNMYLLEWTGGVVTESPNSSVLVNKAIGGWRYGTWAVSLNSIATRYSFSLKTTIYGGDEWHEGSVHFEMSRPDYVHVPREDGWGCGIGHVLWNRQTYNSAKDEWGSWCWLDGSVGKNSSYAVWFQEGAGLAVDVHDLLPVHHEDGKMGGPTDLVSRGHDGWLGVLTSLSSAESTMQRLGLASLPCPRSDKRCKQEPVTWVHGLVPANKGAGWGKLSRVNSTDEASDRFLLGWAQYSPSSKPDWPVAEKFFVAEVDHTGAIKSHIHELDNTAWTERTDWSVIPKTGCVAWVHAWSDSIGPRGDYGSWESNKDGMYSDKLRISTYCPQGRMDT
eukprot:TRINITY_DN5766_c0_g2_i1.p1 TRINITY_DN5766_c0_g2~~TRINITY_DN5766_c0_g2_i1.p1  ORF type:complete len:715 (+),score=68.31 TRINITY_DN5766_c0_g2_i1:103-2247(+)